MKTLLLPALILVCLLQANQGFCQRSVDFLVGTWKVEGKQSFEVWVKNEDGSLTGESYRIKEGVRTVLETLAIQIRGEETVFLATVPDQNEGRTVPFVLNPEQDDGFSFENAKHDFPTKIVYKPDGQNKIHVTVLGPDGKGFDFYMQRQ